jgi:uncharacterized protein (DUF2141 family)
MNGKIPRTRASTAAIATALLLATPILLLITPALAPASITLNPTRGPVGTSVTINGAGFTSGATVTIYFDKNGNGVFEASEIIATPTAVGGSFSINVMIPQVTAGYRDYLFFATDGTASASASFTIPPPAITFLNQTRGTAETRFEVNINYFTKGKDGQIFFDRNNNELPDLGDIIVTFFHSDLNATGGTLKILTVPSDIGFGTFKVVAMNNITEKAVRTFTVEQPVIAINPTFGIAGTSISVSVNFYNKTAGAQPTFVFFDTNGNGRFDTGEPRLPLSGGLSLNNTGGASGALTVPSVPPGIYKVYANNSLGQVRFATFEVKAPLVTITPNSGTAGTSVTIDIAFFEETRTVTVGIDINNNGQIDSGETLATVTPGSGSGGNATTSGTIPSSIGFGTFVVNATNKPAGGGQVATTTFIVEQPVITISPSAGVPGTSISVSVNFYNKTAGAQPTFVFFDTNDNGRFDTGEPRLPASGGLSLNNTGGASGALTVPSVPPGIYKVYANNSLGQVRFATFEVKAPIMSISPTSGGPGTTVAVFLNFFRKDASAGDTFVFFDTNGNGIFDPGEPRSPTTGGLTLNNTGGAVTTIQVPFAISTGSYKIFAVNNLQSKFATFDVVSPEEAIENKLDTIVIPKLNQIISLLTDDTFGLNAIKAAVELVRTRVETIGGTLLGAINSVSDKLGTFTGTDTVASLLYAIEAKLDDASRWVSDADLSAAVSTITSAINDVSNKLGTFGPGETVKSLLYAIEAKLDDASRWVSDADLSAAVSTITSAINDVSNKLGTFGPGETVKSLLYAIEAKLDPGGAFYTFVDNWFTTINNRLGTFSGTDTVASLLYQIKTAVTALDLTPVRAGDVVASKAETDKTTTSATPYVIGGFPANKAFRGTLTVQIDTALGSGVFLAVQVWDGDSWATVWRSATGAPAGTAVSIDIAGLTDGSGNAVRIVTNAATARQFDYVFVYHIDL